MSEGTDGIAEILNVFESYKTAEDALKRQLKAYQDEGFKISHYEPGWVQLHGGLILSVTRHKVITEKTIG